MGPASAAASASASAPASDRDPVTGEVQFSFDPNADLRRRLARAELETAMVAEAARDEVAASVRRQAGFSAQLQGLATRYDELDAEYTEEANVRNLEEQILRDELASSDRQFGEVAGDADRVLQKTVAEIRAETAQSMDALRQRAARDAHAAAEQGQLAMQLERAGRIRDRGQANAAFASVVAEGRALAADRELLRQRAAATYDQLAQEVAGRTAAEAALADGAVAAGDEIRRRDVALADMSAAAGDEIRRRDVALADMSAAAGDEIRQRDGAIADVSAAAAEEIRQRDAALASRDKTIRDLAYVVDEQRRNNRAMVELQIAEQQAEERELARLRERVLGKRDFDALRVAPRSAGAADPVALRMAPAEGRVALRMAPAEDLVALRMVPEDEDAEEARRRRQRRS
jgi:hypothetical protein